MNTITHTNKRRKSSFTLFYQLHTLKISTLLCISVFLISQNVILGNNVVVSNVLLTNQNLAENYTHVQFDISWDNSWRTSTGTSNWDACWVFIKYRKEMETNWNHASLNLSDHLEPIGSTITTPNDGKGIFIYSSNDISSTTVNYNGVRLRWNYGSDGLLNTDLVEVCVFAIEMVYVPEGSFYVGDNTPGPASNLNGQFQTALIANPFLINSEGSLTLGGGGAGSLNNNHASGMFVADDFNHSTSRTLPASFPKGYNGFYCMKYPITQIQYVDFLNKLTRAQQNARTATSLPSGTTSVTNRYVMANLTTNQYRNGIRCDATIHTSNPIVFYCDANGNGIPNESGDGLHLSCSYLGWSDLAAYLDWSGLRPMTELEYEKACRGNQTPVIGEYAWGTTSITQTTGITNANDTNETASPGSANATYGDNAGIRGPMRVGNFGQGNNTRQGVGASYYGIFALSGDLWEWAITVGNSSARNYTGVNGDGELSSAGFSNTSGWNSFDSNTNNIAGYRGGNWFDKRDHLRISDRENAAETYTGRFQTLGGRGVRSAP